MNQIYQKSLPAGKNAGFTLIELLVVVLIIGILSAIALPQYEKAVWKSRNAQLKTAVKSVAQAMNVYYMANGSYPSSFDQLDLDFQLDVVHVSPGNEPICALAVTASDSIRKGKNFQILLNQVSGGDLSSAVAVWTEGKYKCNGFRMGGGPDNAGFFCLEARNGTSAIKEGEFCRGLEQGEPSVLIRGWQHYPLP